MNPKLKEILMYTLGGLVVTGFFVLLYLMLYYGIPESNKDMFNILAGALVASFGAVVQYFYGSSKGSADKNEMLNTPKQ